jgi:hypothetical protein
LGDTARAPRIEKLAWGQIEVDGFGTPFKDAILFPGGARPWDWRETGTSHESGVQPADVQELLDNGARVVILAQGMYGRLKVSQGALQLLKARDVPVHMLETKAAVRLYNELREKEPVGGLFHSTC